MLVSYLNEIISKRVSNEVKKLHQASLRTGNYSIMIMNHELDNFLS